MNTQDFKVITVQDMNKADLKLSFTRIVICFT